MMGPGSLVAMRAKGFEVAEVTDIWEHPDRVSALVTPINGSRCEAFGLAELVELTDARKLRRAPTVELDTPWGSILVEATGRGQEGHWGRDWADKVCIRCVSRDDERGLSRPVPIVINGVEYTFSGAIAREVEPQPGRWDELLADWRVIEHLHLYRSEYGRESTEAARKVSYQALPRIAAVWMQGHPYFLEEARRVVLSNRIAHVEGEVQAAVEHHRDAHERRTALLEEEERDE